jgi:hypothetical protein
LLARHVNRLPARVRCLGRSAQRHPIGAPSLRSVVTRANVRGSTRANGRRLRRRPRCPSNGASSTPLLSTRGYVPASCGRSRGRTSTRRPERSRSRSRTRARAASRPRRRSAVDASSRCTSTSFPLLEALRGEPGELVAPLLSALKRGDDRVAMTFRSHLRAAGVDRPRLEADNATEEPVDFAARQLRDVVSARRGGRAGAPAAHGARELGHDRPLHQGGRVVRRGGHRPAVPAPPYGASRPGLAQRLDQKEPNPRLSPRDHGCAGALRTLEHDAPP